MTVYVQRGLATNSMTPHPVDVVSFLHDYQPPQLEITDQSWWKIKHRDAEYIIDGYFEGTRSNSNMKKRSALFLDLDDVDPSIKTLGDLIQRVNQIPAFSSFEWLLWPTIKNGLEYRDRDKNGTLIPANDDQKKKHEQDLAAGLCVVREGYIWYRPQVRGRICIPLSDDITSKEAYKQLLNHMLGVLVSNHVLTGIDSSNATWSQVEGLPINSKPYHHAGSKFKPALDLEKPKKTVTPIKAPVPVSALTSPEEVIAAIRSSQQAAKFDELFEGGSGEDNSRDDLSLLNILAFWTNKNPQLMDQTYRMSKLHNALNPAEKWDAVHYDNGETYGQHTIRVACAGVTETYKPSHRLTQTSSPAPAKAEKGELIPGFWSENYVSDHLIKRHGADIKHTIDPDKWYIYHKETGSWDVDTTAQVGRFARETIDWMSHQTPYIPANQDAEKFLAEWNKFLKKVMSYSAKNRIIKEAGETEGVTITPSDFNRKTMYINTPEKAYDLETGQELKERKSLLFDQHTNYSPDPAMDAPRWTKFLLKTFEGDIEMVKWFQKVLGYAITGETGEQVFFILLGKGNNGKSVIGKVMQKILGNYAHSANINTFLDTGAQSGSAPNPDIMAMDGKRFVFTAEPKKYAKIDENKVKTFTGEDSLSGRDLHEKGQRNFDPCFKLFISANNMLKLDMDEYSIKRRVIVIPFNHTVKESQIDKHLVDNLLKEAPAIMNWLLEGVKAWKKEGLKTHWSDQNDGLASGYPSLVVDAIRKYETESDNVLRWIEDDCTLEDDTARLTNKELYADYRQWCINNGEKPEKSNWWSRAMGKHGFERWRNKTVKGFKGIKISDASQRRP